MYVGVLAPRGAGTPLGAMVGRCCLEFPSDTSPRTDHLYPSGGITKGKRPAREKNPASPEVLPKPGAVQVAPVAFAPSFCFSDSRATPYALAENCVTGHLRLQVTRGLHWGIGRVLVNMF